MPQAQLLPLKANLPISKFATTATTLTMTSVSTYHCLCTELVLAATSDLRDHAKREGDGSSICPLSRDESITPNTSILTSAVVVDDTPVVLHLDDGFEKLYPARCSRCGLILGYQLDLSQWEGTKDRSGRREDVVFVLPGGLMSTEDVRAGRKFGEREVEVGVGLGRA